MQNSWFLRGRPVEKALLICQEDLGNDFVYILWGYVMTSGNDLFFTKN